jgi:hypothetical protein
MNLDSSQNPSSQEESSEISLLDIVNFLTGAWKKLAIAAIVGGALGLAGWFFLGSYQADIVLNNIGGIDLVGLRSLQKNLPNLADQMVEESKVPQGQESLFRTLTNPEWWVKNVVATYGMSKADTKDLASTAGLENAGTSIVSLTIIASGSSRVMAIDNVRNAKDFLLQGASYLALKSIFNAQESQVISSDAEIAKKMNAAQVELEYQQERLKSLELLAKRFPGEQKSVSQVVDPKDSGAKYMPISTQIIAANTDINATKETLERLKDARQQMTILKTWVTQISQLMGSTYDGITLNQRLLEQESQLRSTIPTNDTKSLVFVDGLRSSLLANSLRFSKGFEMNTAPIATKKGMIKTTIGGLFAAFFLMLLILLGQHVWQTVKSGATK